MPNRNRTSTIMTILLLGTGLSLTACGGGGGGDATEARPADGVEPTATAPATPEPDRRWIPSDGHRKVVLEELVGPDRAVVTPALEDDPLYGEDIDVRMTGFASPKEGECGYEEAVAFAADHYSTGKSAQLVYLDRDDASRSITADGTHLAVVWQGGSQFLPIMHGYALGTDEFGEEAEWKRAQSDAHEQGLGLHGLCPGYGD